MSQLEKLRSMRGGPRDGALLRFSLAQALLQTQEDAGAAMDELHAALRFDADYSAAWKLLGKVLVERNDYTAAMDAYRNGVAAAMRRGDKQAEKEMNVFLRRLEK